MRFLVRASYLQIYNEQISDLLKPERNNLTIREDKKRGVFVEGLSEWVVRARVGAVCCADGFLKGCRSDASCWRWTIFLRDSTPVSL